MGLGRCNFILGRENKGLLVRGTDQLTASAWQNVRKKGEGSRLKDERHPQDK